MPKKIEWRDDSVIKSTSFSFRRPSFNSQNPQVGSQTPPVLDNSTPSIGLCGNWACTYCIDTHAAKTLKGININRLKIFLKIDKAKDKCEDNIIQVIGISEFAQITFICSIITNLY